MTDGVRAFRCGSVVSLADVAAPAAGAPGGEVLACRGVGAAEVVSGLGWDKGALVACRTRRSHTWSHRNLGAVLDELLDEWGWPHRFRDQVDRFLGAGHRDVKEPSFFGSGEWVAVGRRHDDGQEGIVLDGPGPPRSPLL